MKKLIVLLIVLTMVNVASAGVIDLLITSRNGVTLTTPVKEIGLGGPGDLPLTASETIDFQITWNGPATQYLFGIDSFINVSGNGALDYSHFVYATYDEETESWTNVDIAASYDPLLHVINTVSNPDYIVEGAKLWGLIGNNTNKMVVKNLYVHCEGPGNVMLTLTDHSTGSMVIDSVTHLQIVGGYTYGTGITIHQTPIPEPITLTLLGLGSLFLARRKK
jgi:hypothetical protein